MVNRDHQEQLEERDLQVFVENVVNLDVQDILYVQRKDQQN